MLAEGKERQTGEGGEGAGARLEILEMRSLSYQGWDLTEICWEGDSEGGGRGGGNPKILVLISSSMSFSYFRLARSSISCRERVSISHKKVRKKGLFCIFQRAKKSFVFLLDENRLVTLPAFPLKASSSKFAPQS